MAAVAQLGKLASASAVALYGHGEGLVTWGAPSNGGHSSQVEEQLRNVQHIQATKGAFAAILESGAVVTWGTPEYGGDSSQVQEQLRAVRHIQFFSWSPKLTSAVRWKGNGAFSFASL